MSHKYRYVATAALAVVLAAGAAACGSDSEPQLRSEGAAEAAPGVVEVYGSDRHLQVQAAQAETAAREALVAEAAGSDRHLEIRAAELEAEAAAREALIEEAAGSDRHLEILAAELEDEAAPVGRMPIYRF